MTRMQEWFWEIFPPESDELDTMRGLLLAVVLGIIAWTVLITLAVMFLIP